MEQEPSEVIVRGKVETDNRERDIKEWVDEFETTLTNQGTGVDFHGRV